MEEGNGKEPRALVADDDDSIRELAKKRYYSRRDAIRDFEKSGGSRV